NLTKLWGASIRCVGKAADLLSRGKPFDEAACGDAAVKKYNATSAKLLGHEGCPPTLAANDQLGLRDVVLAQVDSLDAQLSDCPETTTTTSTTTTPTTTTSTVAIGRCTGSGAQCVNAATDCPSGQGCCGNRIVDPGETCDDGNFVGGPGDSCPATCFVASCTAVQASSFGIHVTYTHPPGTTISGLVLFVDYSEGKITGATKGAPPFGVTVDLNDQRYAFSATAVKLGGLPTTLVPVTFQTCEGAPPATAADFTCTVTGASD